MNEIPAGKWCGKCRLRWQDTERDWVCVWWQKELGLGEVDEHNYDYKRLVECSRAHPDGAKIWFANNKEVRNG